MKIAVICGGPSLERGISLNSARSLLDHLSGPNIEIIPVYFDVHTTPYQVSPAQLYSNTPSDFDFKLQGTAKPLRENSLIALLKSADLVFPAMHGLFGEDGQIQAFLETHGIPFVGSSSQACQRLFDKHISQTVLADAGFFTLPSLLIEEQDPDLAEKVTGFFQVHQLQRAVVKPAISGSSIGVFSVSNAQEALERIQYSFQHFSKRLVLEAFANGVEFTVIVLANRFGLPVALPPTEIETDYTENQIFDYRKKYLPTRQVTWHCPPRFNDHVIEKIQAQAEHLFKLLGLSDVGRFDGFVLNSGEIWFSDFNPISGMEQNSFLFQQAARIGLTHSAVLRHIIEQAARRQNICVPPIEPPSSTSREKISILFGGQTSERQVSLMSGTNVWLKLRKSKLYDPIPFLWDLEGRVWQVPYQLALSHTVEEIMENCQNYPTAHARLKEFEYRARVRLGFPPNLDANEFGAPRSMSLSEFITSSTHVFIALHGGRGENGYLQNLLTQAGVRYNGSNAEVSALCMDKWKTSQAVFALKLEGLTAIKSALIATPEFLSFNEASIRQKWNSLCEQLHAHSLIIKPCSDGCSSGVVHLHSAEDLIKYQTLIKTKICSIPPHTFSHQETPIEMPLERPETLLIECYIETDQIRVQGNHLHHSTHTGWVEMTIGVIEKEGRLHALNPSITVAEGEVLSVEEKFQGGTGVNITPPPSSLIEPSLLQIVKEKISKVATHLGIRGYCRIDLFVHLKSGSTQLIEINNLPGLTASTVLYHQGLAEPTPLFPRELLEVLAQNKYQG